jgi:hypothetical protein
MTNPYQKKPELEPDSTVQDGRKERQCLMCRERFESAWAGERICPRCRTKSTWREGIRWPSGSGTF